MYVLSLTSRYINQVSFQSLLYFPRYGPDRHPDRQIDGQNSNYIMHNNNQSTISF